MPDPEFVMPLDIWQVNDMSYRELRPRMLDGWRRYKINKRLFEVDQCQLRIDLLMRTYTGDGRNFVLSELINLSKKVERGQNTIRKLKAKLRERYGYNPHDSEIVNSIRRD
jgi:hypothetical protein